MSLSDDLFLMKRALQMVGAGEDGPIVKAMLEGYWVILDELNLAEASILERFEFYFRSTSQVIIK